MSFDWHEFRVFVGFDINRSLPQIYKLYDIAMKWVVLKIRISKLVGGFLKMGYFIGYYTAVPLKLFGKFGQLE